MVTRRFKDLLLLELIFCVLISLTSAFSPFPPVSVPLPGASAPNSRVCLKLFLPSRHPLSAARLASTGRRQSRAAGLQVHRSPKMSCSVLVVAKTLSGLPPMLSHSFDTAGGTDFRLCKVPATTSLAPSSQRPIFNYDENAVPRFAGSQRGDIPEYTADASAAMAAIGFIPQVAETFAYWEAASGICNEKGVIIAECTCSSIFGAEPLPKGKALMGYMELTRIALERCATARDAVDLMGSLAEQNGFYGNTVRLTGAAESLAVADANEAWIFHVLADDSGSSGMGAGQNLSWCIGLFRYMIRLF